LLLLPCLVIPLWFFLLNHGSIIIVINVVIVIVIVIVIVTVIVFVVIMIYLKE